MKRILRYSLCVLAIAALVFLIYRLFITYRTVASVPNPETFFGTSADIDKSGRTVTYRFDFYEDPSDAVQAYADLLASTAYPFRLGHKSDYDDDAKYWFAYNGGKTYLHKSGYYDIYVTNYGDDYSSYSDAYVVEVKIHNRTNFEIAPAEIYDRNEGTTLAVESDAIEAQKTEEAVKKTDINLPPALDDVFSYVYESETNLFDDDGNEYIKYEGCENTAQLIETIESYIELLEDYGYTQTNFTGGSGSVFYTYYLDYSDDSLATQSHRGENCQLAIEGFTSDSYGWQVIEVYYSPDLLDYYRPAGSGGGDDGGEISVRDYNSGGSNTKSGVTVKCTKCHGEKEITCTNCDGKGYKIKYVSTPNYSGHSKTSAESKETCYKCHGSGKITCTRCGGSGVE
ncbi:MAG: hypothetical protein LUG52_06455 [Clostridia bacterium]|nr:hypothetical protein [Clostridia bacterium]